MIEYQDVRHNVRQGRYLGSPYITVTWSEREEVRLISIIVAGEDIMDESFFIPFDSIDAAMEYGRSIAEQKIDRNLDEEQAQD